MKKIVLHIISIMLLPILLSCNKAGGDFDSPPYNLVSIAHLKSMATTPSRIITDDIAIEGHILVNDLFGGYYKSIVLCDNSGGIEIMVDTNNGAEEFPLYTHMTVQCSSLALGNYGGKIELGAPPTDSYNVSRISKSDFSRYFQLNHSNIKAIEATKLTIEAITPKHSGNYIRLEEITFGQQAGLRWCDRDPETGEQLTTERTISDKNGNSLTVRISSHYVYGDKAIPSGYGTIQGVIEYFNDKPSLRIVNNNYDF